MSTHPELENVNDGGHDAPLTPHGRLVYRAVIVSVVVVFFVLLIWTEYSR